MQTAQTYVSPPRTQTEQMIFEMAAEASDLEFRLSSLATAAKLASVLILELAEDGGLALPSKEMAYITSQIEQAEAVLRRVRDTARPSGG